MPKPRRIPSRRPSRPGGPRTGRHNQSSPAWWPNMDKHSAVLGLVQDEPALRAGAASGILDKTCARRSAKGRSAPRNGPPSLTKECNLDLGSEEATFRSHRDIPTRSVPDLG